MIETIKIAVGSKDLAGPYCKNLFISDVPDEKDKAIFRDIKEERIDNYYVITGIFIRGGNHARWRYTEDGQLVFYCKYRKKINHHKITKKGNWEEAYFGDDL